MSIRRQILQKSSKQPSPPSVVFRILNHPSDLVLERPHLAYQDARLTANLPLQVDLRCEVIAAPLVLEVHEVSQVALAVGLDILHVELRNHGIVRRLELLHWRLELLHRPLGRVPIRPRVEVSGLGIIAGPGVVGGPWGKVAGLGEVGAARNRRRPRHVVHAHRAIGQLLVHHRP